MRKVEIHGYRVIVEPRALGNFGGAWVSDSLVEPDTDKRMEQYRRRCEDIAREITRHVDDVKSATIEAESEAVCSHCGAAWTEAADATNNGGCCDEDMAVMEGNGNAAE